MLAVFSGPTRPGHEILVQSSSWPAGPPRRRSALGSSQRRSASCAPHKTGSDHFSASQSDRADRRPGAQRRREDDLGHDNELNAYFKKTRRNRFRWARRSDMNALGRTVRRPACGPGGVEQKRSEDAVRGIQVGADADHRDRKARNQDGSALHPRERRGAGSPYQRRLAGAYELIFADKDNRNGSYG